jgi:hypothetical protein
MNRISWYSCKGLTSQKFKLLVRALLDNEFVENSVTGFRIEDARSEWVSGEYIEKTRFVESFIDPFGNDVEIPRLRFDVLKFQIFPTFPQIQLINPPRSSKNFLNEISRLLGFGVAIEIANPSLKKWIEEISAHCEDFEVKRVLYSEILIDSGIIGTLAVSGEGDVREGAKVFVGSKPSKMTKISFKATDAFGTYCCELSKNGRASVSGGDEIEVIEFLRNTLSTSAD